MKQFKRGLTDNDIRKVEIVYGPECLKRDREEKMEMCQNYPGVVRKKRSATIERRSLRVNPDITPPPTVDDEIATNITDEVLDKIRTFNIETEVEEIVNKVFKVSSIGIDHIKNSLCNNTAETLEAPKSVLIPHNGTELEITKAIQNLVTNHIQSMINNIMSNSAEFCNASLSVDNFLRARCNMNSPGSCPKRYRSTLYGPAMHSTQHRPLIRQSTKHRTYYRAGDAEEETTTPITAETTIEQLNINETKVNRKKRDVSTLTNKAKPHFPESLLEVSTTQSNLERTENRSLSRRQSLLHRFRVKSKRRDSDLEELENIESNEDNREEEKRDKLKRHHKKYSSGKRSKVLELSKKNKEFYNERIWPNGVIPFIITYYVNCKFISKSWVWQKKNAS